MATRRLNFRFALVLGGSLVALTVGTYFLHAHKVRANAGALLVRAERAQQNKDLTAAADYLSRYLSFVPTDADALARYALLLSEPELNRSRRDMQRAITMLERALVRDTKRNDLRRRLVDIQINAGLFRAASGNVKTLVYA